eukprot:s702_g41.t1
MPPGTQNVSAARSSGGTGCSGMDPVVAQMLQQQMLLTQTMMDFMTRSAQASTAPPMPGAQVPSGSSGSGTSAEKLTLDTKWIPAAPYQNGRVGPVELESCQASRDGLRSLPVGCA